MRSGADRQTDLMNLIVAFRNVANAPETRSITLEDKAENRSRSWNINFETEEIPDAKRQHGGRRTSFHCKSRAKKVFFFLFRRLVNIFLKNTLCSVKLFHFTEPWRHTFNLHDIPAFFPGSPSGSEVRNKWSHTPTPFTFIQGSEVLSLLQVDTA